MSPACAPLRGASPSAKCVLPIPRFIAVSRYLPNNPPPRAAPRRASRRAPRGLRRAPLRASRGLRGASRAPRGGRRRARPRRASRGLRRSSRRVEPREVCAVAHDAPSFPEGCAARAGAAPSSTTRRAPRGLHHLLPPYPGGLVYCSEYRRAEHDPNARFCGCFHAVKRHPVYTVIHADYPLARCNLATPSGGPFGGPEGYPVEHDRAEHPEGCAVPLVPSRSPLLAPPEAPKTPRVART